MYKLLKSDILKLRWSKIWIVSIILVLLMITSYIIDNDAAFISSGDYEVLGGGIGFISAIQNIRAEEVIRSSMSYTVFIVIVILAFSVSFFSKEYSQNTIKLFIANGEDRLRLYLSKLIVISGFSLLLYYFLVCSIFAYISFETGFTPSGKDIIELFKLITLNSLVIEVFIILNLLVCIIFKNTGITNIIMFLFLFIGIMMYMSIWSKMSEQPFLISTFIKINPMYYWSTMCAYNFNNNIKSEVIIYFLISVFTLIPISCSILRKQEIK